MDSLPVGSVNSWLAVVVAAVSPLIALIVGFVGPIGRSHAAAARSDGRPRAISL
jgi:hypothetical protein